MESFNYRYDKTYDSGTVDILQLLDLHNYIKFICDTKYK